jgi:fatty acid desaturase
MSGNEINDVMGGTSINLGNGVPQKLNDAVGVFNELVKQYYHIFQLLKIPFFALATFWIFRKKQYNYAEHLIINSYIIAMTTFLFIIAFPVALVQMNVFAVLVTATIIYMFMAYISVFEEKNWKGFLKAIGCYFLATILHTSLVALVVGGIYLSI